MRTRTGITSFLPAMMLLQGLHAADIQVNWSVKLRDPVLQVVSFVSETVYWVRGSALNPSPLDGALGTHFLYKLPPEAGGNCVLSLRGGTHQSLIEHYEEVHLTPEQNVISVAFPDTAAFFDVTIDDDRSPEGKKVIQLFRFAPLPSALDPFFHCVASVEPADPHHKKFGLLYATPGIYKLCVSLPGKAGVLYGRRLYEKSIVVKPEMLTKHDAAASAAGLQSVPAIPIRLSRTDRCGHAVGVMPLPPPSFTFKSVSVAGVVETTTPPASE